MSSTYFFNDQGACMGVYTLPTLERVEELQGLLGATIFLNSEQEIPVNEARLVNGELVAVAVALSAEQQWGKVRDQRSALLKSSDWTQLQNSPLPSNAQLQWANYRQALRDVSLQPDPFNITWPTPPM